MVGKKDPKVTKKGEKKKHDFIDSADDTEEPPPKKRFNQIK